MATVVPSTHTGTHVTLLNSDKVCVGDGYLSTLKAGEVLHTRVLKEDEVAVFVTNVFDSICEVDKPFLEYLVDCLHTVIRWKYGNVVCGAQDSTNDLQRYGNVNGKCLDPFEWKEEGGPSGNLERYVIENKKQRNELEFSPLRTENREFPVTSSAGNQSRDLQAGIPLQDEGMEEPPFIQRKRSYRRFTRQISSERGTRKIGEDREKKVSLQSVRQWRTKVMCAVQCLTNISEREIMDARYDVWVNCKTHDERVTWILRQMRTFLK
jgi:hypothetical protein